MSLRIATFNIENLMSRFEFSGFRNQLKQDRVLRLFEVRSEAEYQRLEEARTIAHTDDTRQLSALAIAECDADILCLQEVDDMAGLQAFEYGYLFKMVGSGYRRKYLIEGNDTRGIDVAVLMREETRDGEPIVCTNVRSHAALTYADLDLHTPALAALSLLPSDRIFKRDCLELDITVGGRPFTLYVVHFKSMGPARDGLDGRSATMPVRRAEALAVRRIIEDRFGAGGGQAAFIIAGDMNDYQDRIDVTGDRRGGHAFQPRAESESALDVFSHDGFAENIVRRRPEIDRWTLFHSRGPQERHLCQLDYLLLSQALAKSNPDAVPEIIRQGQPFRTLFPPGQAVERFPRTGWDRPKASDHCPVVATLDLF